MTSETHSSVVSGSYSRISAVDVSPTLQGIDTNSAPVDICLITKPVRRVASLSYSRIKPSGILSVKPSDKLYDLEPAPRTFPRSNGCILTTVYSSKVGGSLSTLKFTASESASCGPVCFFLSGVYGLIQIGKIFKTIGSRIPGYERS